MHSPVAPSRVTTAQVFAIAGPAMVANLTTPLIGIVSTTAIGRLGDATLLGGVAMASVLFDCMFWLFGFLRMSTVAFTAQSLGAGETSELRAILLRGLIVAALVGAALIVLQMPLARPAGSTRHCSAQRDGRQRGRHARGQNLLHHPDLVFAAGARQLCRAGMVDRAGPRQTGARHADLHQSHQRGGDGRAGAGVRLRNCRRCDRGADRGSRRPRARLADRAPPFERAIRGVPRVAVRPHQADAHARGQPRHHDPHRVADRGVPVLHRAGRPCRRRDARRQCRAQQFSAVRRLFPRRPRQRRRAALRPRLWRPRQGGLRRRREARA